MLYARCALDNEIFWHRAKCIYDRTIRQKHMSCSCKELLRHFSLYQEIKITPRDSKQNISYEN